MEHDGVFCEAAAMQIADRISCLYEITFIHSTFYIFIILRCA